MIIYIFFIFWNFFTTRS